MSRSWDLVIVQTGIANVASVQAAFARLGQHTRVTSDASRIADADGVVLPGVGSFGRGMETLERDGLSGVLRQRVADRRPTLAICLGMQLLCEGSTEAPDQTGLGLLPGSVDRFQAARWVPQMGWNAVRAPSHARFVRTGFAYFAHSYRLSKPPEGWSVSWSQCGERYVSAVEDGGVLACQFHPELSGRWGRKLIQRWLEVGGWAPC